MAWIPLDAIGRKQAVRKGPGSFGVVQPRLNTVGGAPVSGGPGAAALSAISGSVASGSIPQNLRGFGGAAGAAGGNKATLLKSIMDPKQWKRMAASTAAKTLGIGVLADILVRGLMGGIDEKRQVDQQGQALDIQGQYAPQIAEQQALQPVTEARKQQALMMLMRQLGQPMPNTAEGEVWT